MSTSCVLLSCIRQFEFEFGLRPFFSTIKCHGPWIFRVIEGYPYKVSLTSLYCPALHSFSTLKQQSALQLFLGFFGKAHCCDGHPMKRRPNGKRTKKINRNLFSPDNLRNLNALLKSFTDNTCPV